MCPFVIYEVMFHIELFLVTSQGSLPVIELMHALPFAIVPLPTSHAPIDDQPMHSLPILGPKEALVATMLYHTPFSISTPSENGVMPNLLCILDIPPPSHIQSIQIDLTPIVDEVAVNPVGHHVVATQEPPKMGSSSKEQNTSLLLFTNVVEVIPIDYNNSGVAKLVLALVKWYLT